MFHVSIIEIENISVMINVLYKAYILGTNLINSIFHYHYSYSRSSWVLKEGL